ncbi:MAG: trypsin-like peptidase domain-containing protein [Eubacteriales bacterium]|nr:trypsin-like peptidase domain-containing protein [Eubacteriales bacterium]
MDEENNNLSLSREQGIQEVVLHYEQTAQPIVEYYVQPAPLPGRKQSQPAPFTPKRHRGRNFFLVCLAAVLLSGGTIVALHMSGVIGTADTKPSNVYEWRVPSAGEESKTSIPAYPNGDGTKLRYEETHGDTLTIQQVYEKVNPSTVTVMTGLPNGNAMVGTGVIFTQDGYILTNAHVIVGGTECYVVLITGECFEAKLVGFDEEKDLAVIKVDGHDLPAAQFGDSDALTVGDTVYAIGNPLGVNLRGTLTDGIVSAINRDVYVGGTTMTLIQTNAALNNGNSGGPLINQYGQVVGINTMKMGSSTTMSVEGLGFAIPIASTAYMINDLIAYGEIHGEVVIGITVLNASAAAADGGTGLEIAEVVKNGPGEQAGIQVGDYVLAADGERLTSSNDLIRIRRRHEAGEILRLTMERDGKQYTAEVILRESAK